MAKHYPMYLAGKWVSRKERLEVRSPWDDTLIGTVSLASRKDLTQAVTAAERAFAGMKRLPSYRRADICRTISAAIAQNRLALARMMAREVGKSLRESLVEVDRAVEVFRISAEEARRIGGEIMDLDWTPGTDGRLGLIRRFPIGVVVGITPFNFPLNLIAHKVGPALASGNCIVIKPAPKTPIIALMLARLIAKTDLPPGAVSILPATNEDTSVLIEDERVKLISFTGSDRVGWWIKERAGRKRVALELGGNAGVAVADDADLDYAVQRLVVGSFGVAGQSCISVQRVFVHRDIYERFLKRFVAAARKLRVGDPLDPGTDLGTMVSREAAADALAMVQRAVEQGAKVVLGGKARGAVFQPTILTDVKPSMDVCAREIFAPVVAVDRYRTFDEVIRKINDSEFGLQAGIFTNRMTDIMKAFREIECGGVVVNDVPTFRADQQPYGGMKRSGLGREGIRWAIEDMTEIKILSLNVR